VEADVELVRSRLEGWLDVEVSAVRPLESGVWSSAYAFLADGEHLVIRFSRRPSHFEKDRFAHRWSSTSLPIPEVLVVGEADGQSHSISRFVDGTPLQLLGHERWERGQPAVHRLSLTDRHVGSR
jgi:hypothetical protein